MTHSSSRWRFMNPIELWKAFYRWVGVPYPGLSLFVAAWLGAALFVGIWKFTAKLVENDRQNSTPPAPTSVNTTTGPQSPIMPNNGGNVTITNGGTKTATPPPPKDKPK